jgi:uncharacterized protein (TIGR00730 family)
MTRPSALCVYCGSSNAAAARHLDAAEAFGRRLAEAGITLVYGGGGIGLMKRVAEGACAGGGRVVGIIPEHLLAVEGATGSRIELVVVPTMHDRKRRMAELADGFVILPGGFGTLDEMFEIVTWRQLGLHDKPVVLVNLGGYWDPLLAMLDRMVAQGYVRPAARTLVTTVERIEDVLPALDAGPAGRMELRTEIV